MENAVHFRRKMKGPEPCLGTCITFTDPTVTEALTTVLDFVWIDAEHGPLSVAAVQGHIMATRGSQTTPLVPVAWNDPVLIKPILDAGTAGIIVPLIRTAEEALRPWPLAGIRPRASAVTARAVLGVMAPRAGLTIVARPTSRSLSSCRSSTSTRCDEY